MGTYEVETLGAPFQPNLNEGAPSGNRLRSHASASTPCRSSRLAALLLSLACFSGTACARSYEFSYGDGSASQGNWRITCYTCMNVSNNEECNRYAIDRPCPEGRDFCLTLHVMESLDEDRSVLVNKRCAPLEDCSGGSTGCTTTYGQTQCVSCCDQPYCNDYVPINETSAVFHRSTACGSVVFRADVETIWRVAAVLTVTLTTFSSVVGASC